MQGSMFRGMGLHLLIIGLVVNVPFLALAGGTTLIDMHREQVALDASRCVAAVSGSVGNDMNALAAGVDACMGIEPPTAPDCIYGAAKSYGAHGDPERLANELEVCGS